MPSEIMFTKKTVTETLSDIRKMFRGHGIEDHEAVPGEGTAYSIRYFNSQTWVEIESRLQPTKAQNLRQCFQVIDSLLRWQVRGVSGLASGQAFMTNALVPTDTTHAKASEFVEACGTLGVDPDTSIEEIRDVYRVKAKRAHPDAGGDAERFKRLTRALEVIEKVKIGGK